MLPIILAAMAQTLASDTPVLSAVIISSPTPGLCSGNAVSISTVVRASWSATGFDAALHEFKVFLDDILVSEQTSTHWDRAITGLVENDTNHQVSYTWIYRIDVVRRSDSAVLATGSASTAKTFGNCNPGLEQ